MRDRQRLDRPLQASIQVLTTPEKVWNIVADLRRTGEWSPECSRSRALGSHSSRGLALGYQPSKGKLHGPLCRALLASNPKLRSHGRC